MAEDKDEPRRGAADAEPIPSAEPLSEAERERLKQRRHAAGLARQKAGREGRNDPYITPENPYAPRPEHAHSGEAESKQAHGDAASGPDRTPEVSRGNRKR